METDSCWASPAIIDISDKPWHIWISFQWWLGESCSFILVKEQLFSPQFILDWYLCKIQWKELLEKWNKNEIKTKLIRWCQTAINFPNTYSQCLSFSICRPITHSSLPCTGLQNILSRNGLSCEGKPSPECSACHLKLCPSYYFSGFIFSSSFWRTA